MPTLNCASTIGDTLTSLLHQANTPQTTEILVVDGGSSDGTTDVIKKFRVNTILETGKRGPAAARNLALNNSNGEIFLEVDADSIPTNLWLSELVAPFRDSEVTLAGGLTLDFPLDTPSQRYVAASGIHSPQTSLLREVFPFVPGGNFAVRRDAALTIGGWDEKFLAGEDVEFSHRLINAFDTKIRYVPTAVVLHRNRATDEELRRQAWWYGEGAAHIYLRFPEALQWNLTASMKLAWAIASRTLTPELLRARNVLGLSDQTEIDFAVYHRFWTWWFWRGFFSMFRSHRYSQPPPPQSSIFSFYPSRESARFAA